MLLIFVYSLTGLILNVFRTNLNNFQFKSLIPKYVNPCPLTGLAALDSLLYGNVNREVFSWRSVQDSSSGHALMHSRHCYIPKTLSVTIIGHWVNKAIVNTLKAEIGKFEWWLLHCGPKLFGPKHWAALKNYPRDKVKGDNGPNLKV